MPHIRHDRRKKFASKIPASRSSNNNKPHREAASWPGEKQKTRE